MSGATSRDGHARSSSTSRVRRARRPRSTSTSTTTPGLGSDRGSRPTPTTRRWPAAVAATKAEATLTPGATITDVVATLHGWMDADVKATPLKTLQGQIWAAGFGAGELAAHVFADVTPRLRAWHADGVAIAIYSSGSVASQRAWFEHTNFGDLSGLIVAYFDTVNAGAKRDHESYVAIAEALGVAPEHRVVPVGRARRARRRRRRRVAGDRRSPRRRARRGMGLRRPPGRAAPSPRSSRDDAGPRGAAHRRRPPGRRGRPGSAPWAGCGRRPAICPRFSAPNR